MYFELLNARVFIELLAMPNRLLERIPKKLLLEKPGFITIDEVQKIPALLDEVHRLIDTYKFSFILTGSSARKLRQGGANLLAGRAFTRYLYPLTSIELDAQFNLLRSLKYGLLPGGLAKKVMLRRHCIQIPRAQKNCSILNAANAPATSS